MSYWQGNNMLGAPLNFMTFKEVLSVGPPESGSSPIEERLDRALRKAFMDTPVRVEREVVVGNYRVDFMLSLGDIRVIIECDGFEFHHDDQEGDRLRDQFLTQRVGPVLHFAGREIMSDRNRVILDILDFWGTISFNLAEYQRLREAGDVSGANRVVRDNARFTQGACRARVEEVGRIFAKQAEARASVGTS